MGVHNPFDPYTDHVVLRNAEYDDINFDVLSLKPGNPAPTFAGVLAAGGLKGYHFSDGDEVHSDREILHRYKEDSDIILHVHFRPIDNNAGTVIFGVEFVWDNKTADGPSASQIITVEANVSGTAWKPDAVAFAPIAGAGKKIGSHITTRFFRQGGSYGSAVWVQSYGIHYAIDTHGSRQVTVK